MKYLRIVMCFLGCWLAVDSWCRAGELSPGTKDLPSFQEVYGLIRSNLTGISEAELNQAAVLGLIGQLQPQVALPTNTPESPGAAESTAPGKTVLYEDAYGYIRVGKVETGLAKKVAETYEQWRSSGKLKGLILDLRFASGHDYAAAAEVADLFLATEQPLLSWGEATARSTAKTNAINQPLVLLVNQKTSGASEALAAVLRHAELGLVIGNPTAGQARQFKEYLLSNGQRLKIAAGPVQLSNGTALSEKGLTPDIRVAVSKEDETAYLEDPYKVLPRFFAQSVSPNGAETGVVSSGTNRPPRRRINESDLVRMRREGADPEADLLSARDDQPVKPVVNDPVLARALDFLKGLALAQNRR